MTEREMRELSNVVMGEVMELKLKKYTTIFLANMIIERIQHPTRSIDEIANRVMKLMPSKMRREVVVTSSKKSLQALSEELHDSNQVEELGNMLGKNFFRGDIVKNVVNYYSSKIMED